MAWAPKSSAADKSNPLGLPPYELDFWRKKRSMMFVHVGMPFRLIRPRPSIGYHTTIIHLGGISLCATRPLAKFSTTTQWLLAILNTPDTVKGRNIYI